MKSRPFLPPQPLPWWQDHFLRHQVTPFHVVSCVVVCMWALPNSELFHFCVQVLRATLKHLTRIWSYDILCMCGHFEVVVSNPDLGIQVTQELLIAEWYEYNMSPITSNRLQTSIRPNLWMSNFQTAAQRKRRQWKPSAAISYERVMLPVGPSLASGREVVV